jgi:hypothetical protein
MHIYRSSSGNSNGHKNTQFHSQNIEKIELEKQRLLELEQKQYTAGDDDMDTGIYTYMFVLYTCDYTCIYLFSHVYIHIYTYIYVYINMYIYMYIYRGYGYGYGCKHGYG